MTQKLIITLNKNTNGYQLEHLLSNINKFDCVNNIKLKNKDDVITILLDDCTREELIKIIKIHKKELDILKGYKELT